MGWFDNVANVVYEADSSHLYEDEDSLSSQQAQIEEEMQKEMEEHKTALEEKGKF